MDNEVIPREVQKIVGKLSLQFSSSLRSSYSLRDLYQEGWLLWLKVKDSEKWKEDNHQYRFFQTCFKNYLLNCYKKNKRSDFFIQKDQFSYNAGTLKMSLQWAPKTIVDIGEALGEVLEEKEKPTNKNVCKKLGWSPAHTNAITIFKDFFV